MEVGLGPGHTVLDGDPAPPPKKGHGSPTFRPMSIVAKSLDGSRCPGDIVLHGDSAPTMARGTAALTISVHFAMERSPISATAELVLNEILFFLCASLF